MAEKRKQRTEDRRQIEDKHEILSTKFETNSNYQNKKFKTRLLRHFPFGFAQG